MQSTGRFQNSHVKKVNEVSFPRNDMNTLVALSVRGFSLSRVQKVAYVKIVAKAFQDLLAVE